MVSAVSKPSDEASTVITPRPRTDENVFLFVPNLVGYARVILAAASLTYMPTHPKFCTVAYSISCLLDAVDGQAARALGQTSKFGAILDMVTDRCTTSCLLCFLASAYPQFALLFQFLISLDFSSHYIHMYASLISGSASHKSVTKKQSWILWSYYNNSTTLFIFCAGNELFFVALYVMNSYRTPLGLKPLLHLLPHSVTDLLPILWYHALENITWPQVVALLTFPIMFTKQVINCVQFWKASKLLVEADQEERWVKQNEKKRE
ncbi:CDP-alcohol phosphatidyltransferase-domain-containing protein [Leucosporidium creatinivorum]|uniref:CDP-diacylglycerol--inositol 3-phosphatidyltransferase n=1 Tax=Leucosporidium creatinivorum TaxID=106004 RepID=A0A1Y2F514_9BASI|nr:CDP-alcohol phosphatidyltransferase-domain-containing protein [Leucosporidium creatinivorum]